MHPRAAAKPGASYPYDYGYQPYKSHSHSLTAGPTAVSLTSSFSPSGSIATDVPTSVSSFPAPLSFSNSSSIPSASASGNSLSTDASLSSSDGPLSVSSTLPYYTHTTTVDTSTSADNTTSVYTHPSYIYTYSSPLSSSGGAIPISSSSIQNNSTTRVDVTETLSSAVSTVSGGGSGSGGPMSYLGTSSAPYANSTSTSSLLTEIGTSLHTSASKVYSYTSPASDSEGTLPASSSSDVTNKTSTIFITGTVYTTFTSTATISGTVGASPPSSANSTVPHVHPTHGPYTYSSSSPSSSTDPLSATNTTTVASVIQPTLICYAGMSRWVSSKLMQLTKEDNCLRALRATQTPGRLAAAQAFCKTYTKDYYAAIPTYVPYECNSRRVSSACSCIATSTLPGATIASSTSASISSYGTAVSSAVSSASGPLSFTLLTSSTGYNMSSTAEPLSPSAGGTLTGFDTYTTPYLTPVTVTKSKSTEYYPHPPKPYPTWRDNKKVCSHP